MTCGLFPIPTPPYFPSLDCLPGNHTDFLCSFPTKLNFLNIECLGLILGYIKEHHHLLLFVCACVCVIVCMYVCARVPEAYLTVLNFVFDFIYLFNFYFFEAESLTCLELTE